MSEWQPIESAPKITHDGKVPDEFLVWLYDPDAAVDWRVVPAFWNFIIEAWQSFEDTAPNVRRPTHWMPFKRPEVPK